MLPSILTNKYFTAIVLVTFLILIGYFRRVFSYWKRKNVPYVHLGTFRNVFSLVEQPYQYFKANGHKFFGIYLLIKPFIVITDLNLIKMVLIKDFQHFTSHGNYYNEKDDPLSAHLFNLEEPKWRNLRIKLSPTFTSGKMKMMFQTVLDCSKQLIEHVNNTVTKGDTLNIKEVSGCFTTNVIGSCAFGLDCNSFVKPNSKFRFHGKQVINADLKKSLKFGLMFLFPDIAKWFRMKIVEPDSSDFFFNITKNTVNFREKNGVTRKDFLQLLIELKKKKNLEKEFDDNGLTMEEMAAQALVFFLAGFETSSTLMTYCLYELCLNLDVQDKVRNEINEIIKKHNGEITYDGIMEMNYMQQVLDETLRKYPPVPFLFRKCTQEYTLPNTNIKIEKDINVFIPTYQIHHDKDYYPNPEEFKPERFSDENKKNIPQMAFIPFGEGPRICIGLRFGIMQAKVGLTTLLKNFQFTLNKNTPYPLHFSPNTLVLSSIENIYLDVQKI